jgi:hypothetical protein
MRKPRASRSTIQRIQRTCCRCGHSWLPRGGGQGFADPMSCPRCRSAYWQRPKIRIKKQRSSEAPEAPPSPSPDDTQAA